MKFAWWAANDGQDAEERANRFKDIVGMVFVGVCFALALLRNPGWWVIPIAIAGVIIFWVAFEWRRD